MQSSLQRLTQHQGIGASPGAEHVESKTLVGKKLSQKGRRTTRASSSEAAGTNWLQGQKTSDPRPSSSGLKSNMQTHRGSTPIAVGLWPGQKLSQRMYASLVVSLEVGTDAHSIIDNMASENGLDA